LSTLRRIDVKGESLRRSIEWLIKRLIKIGARGSHHAKRWRVHAASPFPLGCHDKAASATAEVRPAVALGPEQKGACARRMKAPLSRSGSAGGRRLGSRHPADSPCSSRDNHPRRRSQTCGIRRQTVVAA
jgi:hypothetical protein